MSLSIWCEPVCATCSDTSEGVHVYGGKVPIRYLVKKAQAAGWIVTRDEFFCCRFCHDSFVASRPSHASEG